jgi:hydroxymethylpyrimidine/phosphomethylpyrimidine kinase
MVQLGEFKKQIENNFVDLYVPSKIATSSALSKLINKVQKISRKIEPNIYEDDAMVDKDLYDLDQIEDLYKNYNILHLCNLYVDGTHYDDEMKQKLKLRLKQLHDKSAYNYDIEQ